MQSGESATCTDSMQALRLSSFRCPGLQLPSHEILKTGSRSGPLLTQSGQEKNKK